MARNRTRNPSHLGAFQSQLQRGYLFLSSAAIRTCSEMQEGRERKQGDEGYEKFMGTPITNSQKIWNKESITRFEHVQLLLRAPRAISTMPQLLLHLWRRLTANIH